MKFAITFFITVGMLSATPIASVKLDHSSTLTVNGKIDSALCIDYNDYSGNGASWKAYVSNVGGDISKTYHPADAIQYEEEAYIFSLYTANGVTNNQRSELQDAAWYLTDPTYNWQLAKFISDPNSFHWLEKSDPSEYRTYLAIDNYLDSAAIAIKSMNFSGFEILSDMNGSKHREQEFIVKDPTLTPEPATNALLGAAFGLAGISRCFFRRRHRPTTTA